MKARRHWAGVWRIVVEMASGQRLAPIIAAADPTEATSKALGMSLSGRAYQRHESPQSGLPVAVRSVTPWRPDWWTA